MDNNEDLNCCIRLKTPQTISNGMKKPAFKRNRNESVGMNSYNKTRQMFPMSLESDNK